jgi:hypothetical protein
MVWPLSSEGLCIRGSGKRWLLLSALQSQNVAVVEHMACRGDGQLSALKVVAEWCADRAGLGEPLE